MPMWQMFQPGDLFRCHASNFEILQSSLSIRDTERCIVGINHLASDFGNSLQYFFQPGCLSGIHNG